MTTMDAMNEGRVMTLEAIELLHDMETGLDYADGIGEATPTSWTAPDGMTFDEWAAIGRTLQQVDSSINWWIGDWLNVGEQRYGDTYTQAVEATGWKTQRLMNAKWVSAQIEISTRVEILSWTHHRQVASLPPEEQAHWLDLAVENDWRSGELKEAIRNHKQLVSPSHATEQDALPEWVVGGDDVPFNHQATTNGQTPVDEYEREADDLQGESGSYDWAIGDDDAEPDPPAVVTPDGMAVHYSSEKHDWETPLDLFNLINDEFGFTLDVCATDETAKCNTYYTPESDGLSADWSGDVCWMNPPYGNEIVNWVRKAYEESQRGATVVCLIPARVDTTWWFDNCIHGEIRFLKGRVSFLQGKSEIASAPFPSAVVIFSSSVAPSTVWWDWKNGIQF